MTEDEAKSKWCPFARVADEPGSSAVNREVGAYDSVGNETVHYSGRFMCIASACMAWRWDREWVSSIEGPDPDGGRSMILKLKRLEGEPQQGRCGLAGQD